MVNIYVQTKLDLIFSVSPLLIFQWRSDDLFLCTQMTPEALIFVKEPFTEYTPIRAYLLMIFLYFLDGE